ncbi:major facilitator family transporter [Agrobacterium tumefaciens str. Cherry 2E-2-2]|nr:major facilitator family transporter [Agrobacterium tumefaciens str. Cherry 2E-2-2]
MAQAKQAPNAWKVLIVLFLANLFNFFDRAVPSILMEPMRLEWGLTDLQLGVIAAAFTVVYAVAGLPLGRLADTGSRKKIMGWGVIVWSGFTALSAAATGFFTFLLTRIGVGVGEASYAPAANSMIGDLFPADKRSRATGVFMLGLPLGLLLAFFTVGAMVKAFDSWRAPFVIAMVPGLVIAIFMFMIREPERGAAETVKVSNAPVTNPIAKVMRIRTMWWIILAGIAANFSAYATNSFMVPLMQRFFGLSLQSAAVSTGVIVGISGLIGLVAGGWIADRAHRRSERGRLMLGATSLAIAAAATWAALQLGSGQAGAFIALFTIGWLLQYFYYICLYPAIQDVVEPQLRATAMALFFAALYLLGGAFGPMVVGYFSDRYAEAAMLAAGATEMTGQFKAAGLHGAFILVPVSLAITAIGIFLAARTFPQDARSMREGLRLQAAG